MAGVKNQKKTLEMTFFFMLLFLLINYPVSSSGFLETSRAEVDKKLYREPISLILIVKRTRNDVTYKKGVSNSLKKDKFLSFSDNCTSLSLNCQSTFN